MPDIPRFSRFSTKMPINFRPISRRNRGDLVKSCQKDMTRSAVITESCSRLRDLLAAGIELLIRDAPGLSGDDPALKRLREGPNLSLAAKGTQDVKRSQP